ncbi:MAG: pyridoxal-phosphate-dependent aminotransferase family protein [Thermomicrobiales bacterium]
MSVNFRLPGPTPLPPAVLQAMQRPMISHRGPQMKELYRSIMRRAKAVHRTDGDVLLLPGSGSAGWELAIVNLLSPGDAVLAVTLGDFGDRFARVGAALGLNVTRLAIEWGSAPTAADVRAALQATPEVKAVFLTHNETSTGVTIPLAEIAAVVREHGALVVVDAVGSVGGLPLIMDEWGLDFVLSGSQKAWMCPPGLVIAGVGPRAWDACSGSTYRRSFFDLKSAKTFAEDGMTATTPPLTLFYAFDAALDMILAEGVDEVWARHAELGARTRRLCADLGLSLFADPRTASDTVTAVGLPQGVSAKTILTLLRDEFATELQGGQGRMADTMLRIGHMGWVHADEIDRTVDAMGSAMGRLGILPSARSAAAVS